jgi:hypothetical protein
MNCRLVVNSCASYSRRLTKLIDSLDEHRIDLSSVIVVLGSSSVDNAPHKESVANVCVSSCRKEIIVVRSSHNHFDFNGLCALCKYADHPLVTAPGYMLIHDTCLCNAKLSTALKHLDFSDPNIIYGPPLPAANICALGHDVITRMAVTFAYSSIHSKQQAVDVEHGRSRDVPTIYSYGRRIHLRPRRRCGNDNTLGETRLVFYYPDFGIFKLVSMRPLTLSGPLYHG